MTIASRSRPEPGSLAPALPPLESGDRLTSDEFERRYTLWPEIRRAELIEGVVYVAPCQVPASRGRAQFIASGWLGAYQAQNEGVDGGDGSTVRLDPENNVQPDAFLRKLVGTSRLTADDYLEGAPELVFEIAASSAAIDLGPKRDAYLRNGVQEYIVWQLYENRLDWFSREGDAYVPLTADARGVIHSKVFPGLKLAVAKLLARDLAGVLREQNRKERAPRA